MKYVTLLLQVGVLYVFSVVGTWIQGVFHLSMPGSLIGMLMLFLLLSTRILPLKWFEEGAEKLLIFLPLFLIPSTTGLMEFGSFLFGKGSIIFLLVVASTVVTLIVSGYISQLLVTSKNKIDKVHDANGLNYYYCSNVCIGDKVI
ncbi:CidA/LrgA family holin-like protein [Bacillus albus]|nr:CidA/LrgA family holin-like protein [Bacillus albus]